MSEEMSIYALPGHQLKVSPYYLNVGYESERENAKKALAPGGVYIVNHTSVGQSHSTVMVEEVPRVAFESLELQREADDRKHPDYIRYFGHLDQ